MRTDKLTSRFQQALSDAQSLAVGRDHNLIEPVHLFVALLDQQGGSTRPMLAQAGINVPLLRERLGEQIEKLPKVRGQEGNLSVGNDLTRLLNVSDKLAQQRGDAYIASELFVLAALDDKGELGRALKASGADKTKLEAAVHTLRGGDKVVDANAEEARQALEKFTIDLTARAELGKLDPVIGDDYRTRDILLTEALSTLIAGLCGGVAQTTPYIGQPAYKNMGARSGYTLMTGVFIGLGGVLGYVSGLVELLPLAVLAPIIIYVAIDITVQAFDATPRTHAPAVVFAFLPAIAYLLTIKLGNPGIVPPEQFARLFADASHGLSELAVIVMLGNGFIITSMLWATMLTALIDARPRRAALTLLIGAVLTAFGVMHSVQPQGGMYLPWMLGGATRGMMLQFAAAYVLLALAFGWLSLRTPSDRT